MKTAKEKIIELLNYKNQVTVKLTKIKLYSNDDLKEIEQWIDEDCKDAIEEMFILVENRTRFDDAPMYVDPTSTCPWCIRYTCSQCTYAKRNEGCRKNNYRKIVKFLKNKGGNYEEIYDPTKILEILNQ